MKTLLRRMALIVILLFSFLPIVSNAADPTPYTQATLESAARQANDSVQSATGWAQRLFGDISLNPLDALNSQGTGAPTGASSALGDVLIVVNLVLMAMGTLWVTYSIMSAGAMTAQEGKMLGGRMNSAWVPIRLTVGAAGLTPFFNGFCLFQILMLSAIQLGIGGGNLAFQEGVKYFGSETGLTRAESPQLRASLDKSSLVLDAVLQSQMCVQSVNFEYALSYSVGDGYTPPNWGGWRNSAAPTEFNFGNRTGANMHSDCGSYKVPPEFQLAFGNASNRIQKLIDAALITFIPPQNFYFDRVAFDQVKIDYANDLKAISQKLISDALNHPTNQALFDKMKADADLKGFVSAGAWAFEMSKKNAALNSVGNNLPSVIKAAERPDSPRASGFGIYKLLSARVSSIVSVGSENDNLGGEKEGWIWKKIKSGIGCNDNPSSPHSIGQCMIQALIQDDSHESTLVRIANAGHNLIWIGLAIGVAGNTLKAADELAESSIVGEGAKLTGAAIGFAAAKGALMQLVDTLSTLSKSMILFGIIAAAYIPLIPFIVWLYRCVGLLAMWVEAVVGASVWAFAHLDTEGEGMGTRARHGYLFLFAVLLNPMLMVVGLLLGLTALEIMADFLNASFPALVASVQGDSTTGLLVSAGYVVTYVVCLLGLVNLCSQLINVVPDQVISWAGGQFQSVLGRNSADEIGGKVSGAIQSFGHLSAGRKGLTSARADRAQADMAKAVPGAVS